MNTLLSEAFHFIMRMFILALGSCLNRPFSGYVHVR